MVIFHLYILRVKCHAHLDVLPATHGHILPAIPGEPGPGEETQKERQEEGHISSASLSMTFVVRIRKHSNGAKPDIAGLQIRCSV